MLVNDFHENVYLDKKQPANSWIQFQIHIDNYHTNKFKLMKIHEIGSNLFFAFSKNGQITTVVRSCFCISNDYKSILLKPKVSRKMTSSFGTMSVKYVKEQLITENHSLRYFKILYK